MKEGKKERRTFIYQYLIIPLSTLRSRKTCVFSFISKKPPVPLEDKEETDREKE